MSAINKSLVFTVILSFFILVCEHSAFASEQNIPITPASPIEENPLDATAFEEQIKNLVKLGQLLLDKEQFINAVKTGDFWVVWAYLNKPEDELTPFLKAVPGYNLLQIAELYQQDEVRNLILSHRPEMAFTATQEASSAFDERIYLWDAWFGLAIGSFDVVYLQEILAKKKITTADCDETNLEFLKLILEHRRVFPNNETKDAIFATLKKACLEGHEIPLEQIESLLQNYLSMQ